MKRITRCVALLFVMMTTGSVSLAQTTGKMKITDIFDRTLNDYQVTLVDWQGHIYNPCIRVFLSPPSDVTFPFEAGSE